MPSLLIHNIGLLATPLSKDAHQRERVAAQFSQAAILIEDGRLAAVGSERDVRTRAAASAATYDARGRLALPGFIDCHTHPVFVGNRAAEFHLRNAGKSYQEIAAAGGGIQATAERVHAAPVEQIVAESLPRFTRSLRGGVTTIEAKSGYGLDWAGERKLLDALAQIERVIPQRMCKTLLIHAIPAARAAERQRFIDEIVEDWIPRTAAEKLAAYADVFCETGAFTVDEARRILLAAGDAGLTCMLHANQFGHSGGALLAAELGLRSANHLEYLDAREIDALAAAGTIGVALPACVFYLGSIPYPPVRDMIAGGMRVAVATDMNPGSAMTESLPFCLTAAAVHCRMTPAELLWAVTFDAARVLDLQQHTGSLEPGKQADITLWDLPDLESLGYRFGCVQAAAVFIDGVPVFEATDAS